MKSFQNTAIAFCMLVSVFSYGQTKPSLTVEGEVLKPLKLTLENLKSFKPVETRTKDRAGKEHIYKGVMLYTILDSAGVTLGSQLRGKNLGKFVLIKAADGYEVIYSLAEIDPEFSNNIILLAYEVDGTALPNGEGPFRLVAPADKKPTRWIREITAIKVLFAKE